MTYLNKIIFGLIIFLFTGCGTYFNQPVVKENARIGELTPRSDILRNFPRPKEPVVVGVYSFKDQTGQYKGVEAGNTFSTAIPQGSTAILLKALEDSQWFAPIERENFANLLNERNIIRTTRDDYLRNNQPNQPNLPPLLYAGILLEGGVVSYDSNILTGGLGARYFGIGGSTQYRQDRITVYLRAVSTSNGKILKTVYVSKTILSQALSAGMFRYVNFQRLMEAETGFTQNEPIHLALKDAIEKAVESLIVEGIQDKLWSTEQGEVMDKALVAAYLEEKKQEEETLLYGRIKTPKEFSNTFSVSGNAPLFNGDYSRKKFGSGLGVSYSRGITDFMSFSASGELVNLKYGYAYSKEVFAGSLNADFYLLPYEKLSPFVYGGGGILIDRMEPDPKEKSSNDIDFKVQFGVGMVYQVSDRIGLKIFAENNLTFTDKLDGIVAGKWNDFYYNLGIGVNYYFGRSKTSRLASSKL